MSHEYSLPTPMKLYEEALKESVAIQAGKFTTKEPDFSNAYLNEFFLLLETGNYYFIKNATESKVYTIQDMNTLFFNRMPKGAQTMGQVRWCSHVFVCHWCNKA